MKTFSGTISIESVFSDDDRHRFVLRRKYVSSRKELKKGKVVFLLINPSFSDELLFDKTNRLASNIGVLNEFNEVVMLNLFSLITPDTKTLDRKIKHANQVENDDHILEEVRTADLLILSWGNEGKYNDRINKVKKIIKRSRIDAKRVQSIKFVDKNGKEYNPAHLSMYLTENPPNFTLESYDLD